MFADCVALEHKTEVGEHAGGLLFQVVAFNRAESRAIGRERFAFPIQEGQHFAEISLRESGIINLNVIHDGRLVTAKNLDSLSKNKLLWKAYSPNRIKSPTPLIKISRPQQRFYKSKEPSGPFLIGNIPPSYTLTPL